MHNKRHIHTIYIYVQILAHANQIIAIIMNVVASSRWSDLKQETTSSSENPPAAIVNFYNTIPNYELTLDEFELYALKRLRVRMILLLLMCVFLAFGCFMTQHILIVSPPSFTVPTNTTSTGILSHNPVFISHQSLSSIGLT